MQIHRKDTAPAEPAKLFSVTTVNNSHRHVHRHCHSKAPIHQQKKQRQKRKQRMLLKRKEERKKERKSPVFHISSHLTPSSATTKAQPARLPDSVNAAATLIYPLPNSSHSWPASCDREIFFFLCSFLFLLSLFSLFVYLFSFFFIFFWKP